MGATRTTDGREIPFIRDLKQSYREKLANLAHIELDVVLEASFTSEELAACGIQPGKWPTSPLYRQGHGHKTRAKKLMMKHQSAHTHAHKRPFSRKKSEYKALFGVTLEELIERDHIHQHHFLMHTLHQQSSNQSHPNFNSNLNPGHNQSSSSRSRLKVPHILRTLIDFLRSNALEDEGILRISGSLPRVQALKEELEDFYYYYECGQEGDSPRSCVSELPNILEKYTSYDIGDVLKHFIRSLPIPLLTGHLLDTFLLVPRLGEDPLPQIQLLNLLVILLPDCHRDSLESLLKLLWEIAEASDRNKMSLHNLATIMAPNLFPNLIPVNAHPNHSDATSKSRSGSGASMGSSGFSSASETLDIEMARAKNSCHVTRLLIEWHHVLFKAPPYLMEQIKGISRYSAASSLTNLSMEPYNNTTNNSQASLLENHHETLPFSESQNDSNHIHNQENEPTLDQKPNNTSPTSSISSTKPTQSSSLSAVDVLY